MMRGCVLIILCIFLLSACSQDSTKTVLFKALEGKESGIHFINQVYDNDSTYSFINEFGYMGGGVGIGDFNNDGLKDIVFTGNQVSSRIYINKGDLKFEDITVSSGFSTHLWATGVSIVDINNDGFDDIYICTYGDGLIKRAPNLLFINQGDLTFKEMAAEYGLADTGYSSQAVFFDYDNDGDLDMYLANYSFNSTNTSANNIVTRDTSGTSIANDRLYRNEGLKSENSHPVFTDVSMQAGIKEDGYGLGVTVSDLNNDGLPDIYIANDFLSNDCLWLNNGNGTFTNVIANAMRHQSYNSMGVDVADLTNNGLMDVVTLDMWPENNERRKNSFFFMNYYRYQAERFKGYEPEFMRNVLQVNQGVRNIDEKNIPFFSEIGQLAGISATDWSWSILLADFNLDGQKDMHITNGVGRDFINADFIEFSSNIANTISDKEASQRAIKDRLASLNNVALPNYLYLGKRNYQYENVSETSGIYQQSISNGAAYADLDNDGDLDLIVNNINQEAFVWINQTLQKVVKPASHYIKIRLIGNASNQKAFGAKVIVYQKNSTQVQEQNPVRGYYSSVDTDLIFGLSDSIIIDSIVAIWPDGKRTLVQNSLPDTMLTLNYKNAQTANHILSINMHGGLLFTEAGENTGIDFTHAETLFNDFGIQRLLPQKYSQLGPFVTTADVNKDGLIDFFVGGAAGQSGKLFIQQKNSTFKASTITNLPKPEEDMACLFFDADGDNDEDLLITYGDIQAPENDDRYIPKLWLNDGKGDFILSPTAIPAQIKTIGGVVATADFDGDGDLDLFIGGRVSHKYPISPRSYVLQNNGGVFKDITNEVSPSLVQAGMVTSAQWTDIDKDGKPDLVIAGEWMPIRIFKNTGKKLVEVTNNSGIGKNNGMWRSLAVADLDGDGDFDIVAGNLGQNCMYSADSIHPVMLYVADIDQNGILDPVQFHYIKTDKGKRELRPSISRAQFADQVPSIKKKFLLSKDYALAGYDEIFTKVQKDQMLILSCDETRSCWFENLGNGKFIKHPLPIEAQFAPVNAIVCADADGDGIKDIILAGNEYEMEVITGRYDASYGTFLKGMGKGKFKSLPPAQTGLVLDGDIKSMLMLPVGTQQQWLIVAANNSPVKVFTLNP